MTKTLKNSFNLSIAGIVVSVQNNNDKFSEYFRNCYSEFLVDDPPNMSVRVLERDGDYSWQTSYSKITFDGGIIGYHSAVADGMIKLDSGEAKIVLSHDANAELDYFIRLVYAYLAFKRGGVLLHGAGIIHRERGYIFLGHSGSGKTTICRLSSPSDLVLNDDLLMLLPVNDSWWAYSTPFWNPDQIIPRNLSVSIGMICCLIQDQIVRLDALPWGQAVAELVASVPIIASDPQLTKLLIERCKKISEKIPVYHLRFLPDVSFWQKIDTIIVKN
jgi:hypothetical protein